jgi:hypothetical protein
MRRLLAALVAWMMLCVVAEAQQNRTTLNYSAVITTGLTYQQLRPAENRWSITIQNNQTTTDNCYVFVGAGVITAGTTTTATNVTVGGVSMTAAKASILLTPGSSWSRYYPYVPSDPLYGTCASNSDSLYLDQQ